MKVKVKTKGREIKITVSINDYIELLAIHRASLLTPFDITEEERGRIGSYCDAKGLDYDDLTETMGEFFDQLYGEIGYSNFKELKKIYEG